MIVAAIVVAVVAFLVLRPGDGEDDSTPTATRAETQQQGEPTATVRVPPPPPRYETIRIAGGEPQGGRRKVTVEKGEVARFQIKSDAADQIHLHGYDIYRDVAPGKPARFRVKADIEGVFEIEAHDLGHAIVGSLVVEP
jgi:hypothetical protein